MDIDQALVILGLDHASSAAEVRLAFRRGLHERHPDLPGTGSDAGAKTRDLIAAYRLALVYADPGIATRLDGDGVVGFEAEVTPATRSDSAAHGHPVAQRMSQQPTRREPVDVRALGDDTIAFGCPADEAYPLLIEVAHRIGDVTHIDRSSYEFLEFLVRSVSGDTLSVVCSLQGRSNGSTEAFFTIEPLDVARGPLPPVSEIVELFVDRLQY